MSIMAPFFPREAAEKGLSDTLSGFIFSFYALVMFLTSPIFGKIVSKAKNNNKERSRLIFQIPKFGTKVLFLSGMLVAGACNLLFA